MQTPTTRTFKLLITSAVLIPGLMFLFAIWRDYRAIQEANRIELTRTVITFKHHALNVFETHQLIAERVNERLKGLDWDRIAGSSELRPFLKSIVAEYPQAQAIWLADPSGVVRNGSEILPEQPISIRDRDYFKALLEKDCGIFVGHIVKPLVMRKLNFNLACRRMSPTGRFDGVIIVTVFPEYFSNFWSSAVPRRDSTVTLLRGDGSILSRMPGIDPDHLKLPPGSQQLATMKRAEQGIFSAVSDIDGIKRSYSYRKLDKYDAYVMYGVAESSLLHAWLRHVRKDGCFFALGMATLLWFSLAANRYSRREQAARLALQESEERLRQLGDNLPDSAVYQYVHEDDGAVRFIYFSKGIERLNGVGAAEVLRDASVLLRQVTPEFYREMVATEAESARTGSDFAMELPMLRSDGELRWMQLHSRPRRLPNGRVVWDGVQTDVTSRRQAEDALRRLNEELDTRVAQRTLELRQKDQLMIQQSRHAAMGEMIHNIAHQWRQPLNALGLTVQRLQFYYELGEFDKDLLDQSVDSAMLLIQHMSKTIDDFRDFFKPDKEPEEFTVSQVVQRTLTLIKASFESCQIRIVCDSLEDITVTGYPNEYSQVILNILNNAKDALLVREIADPVVTIAARAEAGRSVLTISDNAGGIAEDILPKVFDPLFTTKGPQGTGIGLFMAKTIIERSMSGEVTVRNAEAGAEFRIVV